MAGMDGTVADARIVVPRRRGAYEPRRENWNLDEARRQRERWERVAARMPDLVAAESTQYYRRSEIALVDRYVGPLHGRSVLKLDLWNEAFNTRLLQWMSGQGAVVHGMDLSSTTTRRAAANMRTAGHDATLAQADIRFLPFAGESFDFVYTMGTIEHIAEYEMALGEIRRVLRPGGVAIIGVPNKWDPFFRPVLVRILDRFGRYPYSPEKCFSAAELSACVERAGLTVTARTGILFLPGLLRFADLFLHVRESRLQRLGWPLVRLFEGAERRWHWARRLGYLLTIVATKPAEVRPDRA